MSLELNNINRTKIKNIKPLTYAQVIKFSTPLPIKKIPIREWLRHYELEEYIDYFGKTPEGLGKHSKNMNSIKHNTDILKRLYAPDYAFNALKPIVRNNLSKSGGEGRGSPRDIPESQKINLVKEHLFRFVTGIKFLEDQAVDYRKLSSPLGLNATRQEYLDFIDETSMLDFLDTPKYRKLGINRTDIARKLKILTYDDIANMYHRCLIDIISSSDEILKLYSKEKNNFYKGISENMTEKEFETAIKKNTLFERFQTTDNEYELEDFYQSILKYYSPKEYLKTNQINIFLELFSPLEKIPQKIVAKKIYEYFFPKEEDVFSNQRLKILEEKIPVPLGKSIKPRIFYISAHGDSCPLYKYRNLPRLNIKQAMIDFNKELYMKYENEKSFVSYENVMFIANQPIGRLSLIYLIKVFIDLFTEKHRKTILNAILGARNKNELQIIQQFFDIYVYKHIFKDVYTSKDTFEGSFEDQMREFESRTKLKNIYPETEETSKEYLNFVRYNYNNPPPDTEFHFTSVDTNENLTGIFELNLQNGDTLKKLSKSLNFIESDTDMNMGLSAEKIFKHDSIPEDLEEVVKYNKVIKSTGKTNFTHSEVLNLILENADIKKKEYVVIFTNQCRGITSYSREGKKNLNTIKNFNSTKIQANTISKFRRSSLQRSLLVRPPRFETSGSKKKRKHKRKYSIKNKKK